MPVLVKDYEWTETLTTVHITVPLKGVKSSKVDLINTDEFLKANFPPFLFEILLFDKVEDEKSNAKIREGLIEFRLTKQRHGIWGKLTSSKSEDKAFMLEKKKEVVAYVQKRTEEEMKQKKEKKNVDKKYALREMMKLENKDRERIENVKESERIKAVEEMEEWKKRKQAEEEEEKRKLTEERMMKSLEKIAELSDYDGDALEGEREEDKQRKGKENMKKEIFKQSDVIFSSKEQKEQIKNQRSEVEPKRKSGPRIGGKINFNFTPRVFPTPLRESKTLEEEEWLQKQAEARKISEVDDPDLKEHEKDPEWLKDKGNKLFASGNYLAAVNAYNLAIRIQKKKHVLYLNRAACHLKLRNLHKCIEDSSSALDLLTPPVPDNAKSRLKSHVRRGTAFCDLELYAEGLQDYMAALKIEPDNEELKQDAENIRQILQSGDDLVESGDDLVESGDDLVESGDDLVESGDDLVESGDEMK